MWPEPPLSLLVRLRRWARLAGVLAATGVTGVRAPLTGAGGRRSMLVRGAARVLTALDIRVQVTPSPAGWPRSGAGHGPGHLVVANSVSWVDRLALLTVVPGRHDPWPGRRPRSTAEVTRLLAGGRTVTVRPGTATPGGVGRFQPDQLQAAVDAGAPVCPVAVRHGGVPEPAAGRSWWRHLVEVVGARDLVVEVHLLPALQPAGAGAPELAALAEYAVAAVTETRRSGPVRHLHSVPASREVLAHHGSLDDAERALGEQDRMRQSL